ncbi:MAG: glycoside hydrolase family 3 C-terminal domain-containing protein [Saprospiraceae bacterium]|nr:glycoside hydrolase family 3 C-terminal domain-containing protein [Saprospiraceae bacterium]
MKLRFAALFLCYFLAQSQDISCQTYEHPFQDLGKTITERVDNLISLLSLEEKAAQLMYAAPAIDRLGIPEFSWWNECLHGVARNGRATIFPQAIGLGAAFDPDLMHRIGIAISDEARVKFHQNDKIGYRGRYSGLTFWSPNVNLFRDPRWGRGQETYGEDPHLISRLGVAFVQGLQGDDPEHLKVAAMAKHYAVHSGPEKLRHEFDAVVSQKDLWNTYLPGFEALVTEAKVEGVMGAYNRTNGDVCCAHPYLMQEVLRDKWQFKGYYVSDCWAIQDFFQGHNIVETREEAAALALKLGCNLNCGSTYLAILSSLEQGLTTEREIDDNLRELFPTRFRLGLFDPPGSSEYESISPDVVRSSEHIALSYEAAAKSLVLLKNQGNLLPLDPEMKTLFVTGPTAADMQALLANYYGLGDDMRTLAEGIISNVSDHTAIRYVQGGLLDRPNVNPMDWFSGEAQEAEVTIACMGITQLLEGEEGEAIASPSAGDREYITLPPHQIEYLKLLRSKAEKLVVVITGGSAISIPEVHEMADAVVYAWYPGEQGGQALGDMLFGKFSPSGKLPVTFVQSISDLPPFEDYNMKGRTYRYMEKAPLFPFGFGLSYVAFTYENLQLSTNQIQDNNQIHITLHLSNQGTMEAEEVVQLYISKNNPNGDDARYSLKEFQRVTLPAGATTEVIFEVDKKHFSTYDNAGDLQVEEGTYTLYIGGVLPIARSLELGAAPWLEETITVRSK